MRNRLVRLMVWVCLSVLVITAVGCARQDAVLEGLQTAVDEHVGDEGPGTVLLVDGPGIGQQIVVGGLANREENTPARTVNHFRLAGLTKPFISSLILQLAAEGDLTLDDRLNASIPAAADLPNSETITIQDLLMMTSGIADYRDNPAFWTAVLAQEKRGWELEELLAYATELSPAGEPGEFNYSNTNYILLHMILLDHFGDKFLEELGDRVFDPVGMPDTYMEPIATTTGGHIGGYKDLDGDGTLESMLPYDDGRASGDLGIISNAMDLADLAPALYGRELYDTDGQNIALATVPMPNGDGYGYGIMQRSSVWGDMWGYASTDSGFSNQMWYLPDQEVTIILLMNAEDEPLADALVQDGLTAVFEVIEE